MATESLKFDPERKALIPQLPDSFTPYPLPPTSSFVAQILKPSQHENKQKQRIQQKPTSKKENSYEKLF